MYKFDINVYESIYEIYYITLIKSSLYFRVDEMDFNLISLLYLYTDMGGIINYYYLCYILQ